MKRYAVLIAFLGLLIPAAVGAEPTPPAGYSCQFYTPTCDEIGGGGLCRSYLAITEFPVGNLVYFSDESYGYSVTPIFNSDGAGNGTAISQGEIYTITETIVPLDDFLPPGMFSVDTPYSVSGAGVYRCYEGDPTPTPSPSPTPVTGLEVEIDWYNSGCTSASVNCFSADNPWIYANGVKLGRCLSDTLAFDSRPTYTNTIILADTQSFSASVNVTCNDLSGFAGSVFTPTMPTLPTPPPPPTDTMGAMGATGPSIPMPEFGGDLGDPNSPINRWLGHATSTINSVNRGNLLYIVGGVASAGMILTWAIQRVKNPKGL
jgi:hypothetical protein